MPPQPALGIPSSDRVGSVRGHMVLLPLHLRGSSTDGRTAAGHLGPDFDSQAVLRCALHLASGRPSLTAAPWRTHDSQIGSVQRTPFPTNSFGDPVDRDLDRVHLDAIR